MRSSEWAPDTAGGGEAAPAASERSERMFMPLNCSALAEQLLESELFGHERGAFTDATSAKAGLFEVAAEPATLAEVERSHILRVLESTGGRKAPAARLLGINVETLSRKLVRYRLQE